MNIEKFQTLFSFLPSYWDGKECILDMKSNNSKDWKQMEWLGFYFQYLLKLKDTDNILTYSGIKYGKTSFDAHCNESNVPLDIKFHCNTNQHGIPNKIIPLNDCRAIDYAIDYYGKFGLIVLCANAVYDETGEFKLWHDSLKGKSRYMEKAILENKKSRTRKIGAYLSSMELFYIDHTNKSALKYFQKGMKNSNDNLRNEKYSLNFKDVEPFTVIKI